MGKVFLFFRWLVISVTALVGSAIISTVPAVAQEAAQSTSTSSDITNASPSSNFQDAAAKFQQSDNSAANTASGSASILRQENNGKLTVDGAPANSGTSTSSGSSAKLWLSVIFFVSAIGLVIAYVYSRRSSAKTEQKAEMMLEETKAEKPKKKAKKAAAEESAPAIKKSKPKKSGKKKNKKHHR